MLVFSAELFLVLKEMPEAVARVRRAEITFAFLSKDLGLAGLDSVLIPYFNMF